LFGRLGGGELLVILLIVLLLFGARKLPQLARSLGASAKEFRKGIEQGAQEADLTDSEHTPDS
jgi:sec-independent protein translocase protein TatA